MYNANTMRREMLPTNHVYAYASMHRMNTFFSHYSHDFSTHLAYAMKCLQSEGTGKREACAYVNSAIIEQGTSLF